MNGGSLGGYTIWAPWGDTMLASMTGTGAAFMGAEPYSWYQDSGQQSPEPLRYAEALAAGDSYARGVTGESDSERRSGPMRSQCTATRCALACPPLFRNQARCDACVDSCVQAGASVLGQVGSIAGLKAPGTAIIALLVGAGIVLIGVSAIAKG